VQRLRGPIVGPKWAPEKVTWAHHGPKMGPDMGLCMGPYLAHGGPCMVPERDQDGPIMCPHIRSILDLSWAQLGPILGPVWVHFGVILGRYGPILRPIPNYNQGFQTSKRETAVESKPNVLPSASQPASLTVSQPARVSTLLVLAT
jgi:hypothetical protein